MLERKNDAFLYRFNDCDKDWKQDFLLISDIHWDSILCDRKLLFKHLDEAKEKNARILIFGDFFDVMGGKHDPRTTKADIRSEYSTQHYFQDVIMDAGAQLKSYKHLIDMISEGSHETNVKMRHEVDLLSEHLGLCMLLKCKKGKHNGFIRFLFTNNNSDYLSKTMYYTHGGGGNAPVTKGTIKTNRRQEAISADWFVSGHIHTEFEMPRTRASINKQLNLIISKIYHWQLGTYKNEFLEGGWADHKEFAPANLGGRWLELSGRSGNIKVKSYLTN